MFSSNDICVTKINNKIYYNNHTDLYNALLELDEASYRSLSFHERMKLMLNMWTKLNQQIDLYTEVDDLSHNQKTYIYTFMFYDDIYTADIYDSEYMESIYAITGNDLFVNHAMIDAYDLNGLKSYLIACGIILQYDQLMMIHNNNIQIS